MFAVFHIRNQRDRSFYYNLEIVVVVEIAIVVALLVVRVVADLVLVELSSSLIAIVTISQGILRVANWGVVNHHKSFAEKVLMKLLHMNAVTLTTS